jgi:chromosomal replication initiation ATPase DnaA
VLGRGATLLLTATEPPSAWPVRLPDLRSRLLAAWPVRIEPPDDALLRALLVKQFADRQLRVEPAVIEYLIPRLERSFASMREAVDLLDRAALRNQRPITLPLARKVLLAGEETDEPP